MTLCYWILSEQNNVKISYPELVNCCTILARTVQNVKARWERYMGCSGGRSCWLVIIGSGKEACLHFDDHIPIAGEVGQGNNNHANLTLHSVTQNIPNSTKVGWKMSAWQYFVRMKKQKWSMLGDQLSNSLRKMMTNILVLWNPTLGVVFCYAILVAMVGLSVQVWLNT
jgi:hypothetical protein